MDHVIGHPNIAQVVFAGPFGVGKTTAVRTLSDVAPLTTEAFSTPMHRAQLDSDKTTTTVGIDYGEWTSPDGRRVALIGTPGQSRFTAMRRTAMTAGAGVVLWLFGNHGNATDELTEWLTRLSTETTLASLTVAITRTDQEGGPPLREYRHVLNAYHPDIPLVTADPRRRDHVIPVVLKAISLAAPQGGIAS